MVLIWHANKNTKMQRPRLISPFSLAGFVVAVLVVLILLYPHRKLYEQVEVDENVDAVSIQYLLNLLTTEPDNFELRLHLAKSYVSLGEYEKALNILAPLFASDEAQWREKALLVKLDILLRLVFAEQPGSIVRGSKMAQFSRTLQDSEKLIGTVKGLRQLVHLAELSNNLDFAELIMARLLLINENLIDLDEAARVALANGHYLLSAQYTWRSRQLANDDEKKIAYLQLAMRTLQAGGLGHIGLDWVQALPYVEWQRKDVLFELTKLAMASNRPKLASELAQKLVGLVGDSHEEIKFVQSYFEIAYVALLGNQDLLYGLKLAQIAVKQSPNDFKWHERLAQVAEWSGHPQIAIVEWRWLAQHQGEEKYWQSWMRLADALFDYQAQITGLEHEWKRNGHNEKYVKKIVQLYEYLGQPEDAVAWLDRNGNAEIHPEYLVIAAEILNSMGKEAEAVDHYRLYLSRNTASPELAVTIATLWQRMERYQEAYELLLHTRDKAKPDHKLFWVNFGELAWRLKEYDEAIIAYRHLSDAPDAELNEQVRLFQSIKMKDLRLAAQTAEIYWLKSGRFDLFMSAVDSYAALKDWQSVQRLYKITDAPKWRDYDNNLRFISLRAEMYKNVGNYAAAERDYRFLAMHYPNDMAIKESYLWMLIDAHNFNQLDVLMQRWEKFLPKAQNLWDVFAAGHLALSRPSQAIIIYDRMATTHANDELWLINYASTLETVGQIIRAGKIRNQVWKNRKYKTTQLDWLKTSSNVKDIEALRMLLLNDPSLGQGVLWKLLKDGSDELKQNTQFIELAAAWLNDHDQNDASRAWLIRQYARKLNTTP